MTSELAETAAVAPPLSLDAATAPEREALRTQLEDPQSRTQSWTTLIVLVVLSFLWLGSGFDTWSAVVLLATILVHELGHFVAMRAFGYADTSIYLVPFMGGLAIGRPTRPSAWAEGIVLLAGPLPGMLLATLIAIAWGLSGEPMSDRVANTLGLVFFVNAFNLLPAGGLDGGRLFQLTLLAGRPRLETAFAVLTSVALGLLFWSWGDYLLVGLAAFWVIGAFSLMSPTREAADLRKSVGVLPLDPAQLSDEQVAALHGASIRARESVLATARPEKRQSIINTTAKLIHARAATPRASMRARVGLFAIYVFALLPVAGLVWFVLSNPAPG